MWYYITSLLLALVNSLDLLINIVAVRILKFNLQEIAILNALWTLVILFSSIHTEILSQRGCSKRLLLIGFLLLSASLIVLYLSTINTIREALYVSYMLHAVAFIYCRVGVQTSIVENYFSNIWGSINRRVSATTILLDGLFLTLLSILWINVFTLSYSIILLVLYIFTGLLSYLIIPQPILRLTRLVEKIERNIAVGLIPIDNLLVLSSLDPYMNTTQIKTRSLYRRISSGVGLIIISLVLFKISSEYLFTPLPYILINMMSLSTESVLMLYGLGKILASILLALIPLSKINNRIFSIAIAIRVFSVYTLLAIKLPSQVLSILLSLIYVCGVVIDISIYTTYLKITGGEKITAYTMLGEIASFIGALTSSQALRTLGLTYLSLTIGILNTISLLILLKL
ncbi:MAG: hypothetical protein LM567_02635 [Desulfurococcaceae archaeon]|nr:hypothetical protein [Desulfurococcaceae archaeon]